jgi:hypothetical protein
MTLGQGHCFMEANTLTLKNHIPIQKQSFRHQLQEKFVFRFRLSFEKCIFLKNEIQFDKFDGFYLMDHILN